MKGLYSWEEMYIYMGGILHLHHFKSGVWWGRWNRQKAGWVPDWKWGVSVEPVGMERRGRSGSHFDLGTGLGEEGDKMWRLHG